MEFIEREDFLTTMNRRFKEIATEEGHCFFIMGEPGIGKTSLVKVFLNQVEDISTQYVCACDSLFTPRPLAPLYDLALQLKVDWSDKIDSIFSRAELFTRFLEELTRKNTPIILVFEDIHWADEATLDFIKFLARRISRIKCLFILTCRDDEVSQQNLRKISGDLSPDTFTRIQLMPLSKEAVYKLADEKGFDAENVYNISGGNPFYLNEILANYSPGVPDNIKDAILSVYDRQEEGTKNAWQIFSVISEGLEIDRFAKIKSSWDEEMDRCFALKVIVVKNDRIIFKHELYRRTIESSLSPFKRIALNKKILELFLDSFEEKGEVERIVHYAKNANENKLVVKYAPLAARQAASVGAHIEASKLFLTAIEYSDGNNMDQLVELYEAYTYECYLTNQIKDAIIYQGKALKIWQKKNETEKIGNSFRFLSRLWWYDGNNAEAEKYAKQAIDILELQPSSKAKAMAFSNMSQLKMLSHQVDECIFWGEKAIGMAKDLEDEETLCHALNNVGTVQLRSLETRQKGMALVEQSLAIALKNHFHDHVARAYTNLENNAIRMKDYAFAKEMLEKGIQYCEERDLDSYLVYLMEDKARMHLDTGNWTEAFHIAKNIISNENHPAIVRIDSLAVAATIKMRRGNEDVFPVLFEAKEKAFETGETQRIMPVMIAMLEYEWLTGTNFIDKKDIDVAISLSENAGNLYQRNEFAFWLLKARKEKLFLEELYEGYRRDNEKMARKAATLWKQIGCPYEQALALFESNETDKRTALSIMSKLGAEAVAEKLKFEMRSLGIKSIPRGIRRSTRSNPANLTTRELDILQLLKEELQNKEIANKLFISPKTVDHHISSILFKLDVNSRARAVTEAVRLHIIK